MEIPTSPGTTCPSARILHLSPLAAFCAQIFQSSGTCTENGVVIRVCCLAYQCSSRRSPVPLLPLVLVEPVLPDRLDSALLIERVQTVRLEPYLRTKKWKKAQYNRREQNTLAKWKRPKLGLSRWCKRAERVLIIPIRACERTFGR